MSIIGIDMDGCIADFTSLAIKRVNKLYSLNLTIEEMREPKIAAYTYELISNEHKKKYNKPEDMYKDICPAGFFYDIEPFEGAIEAVKKIAKLHQIVFITKPLDWKNCPDEKHRWLKKYFPDMKYEVMLTSSMQVKGLVEVDVFIEDDPRTIKSLNYAAGILIRQPWNEDHIDASDGVVIINSIKEAPEAVEETLEYIFKW